MGTYQVGFCCFYRGRHGHHGVVVVADVAAVAVVVDVDDVCAAVVVAVVVVDVGCGYWRVGHTPILGFLNGRPVRG